MDKGLCNPWLRKTDWILVFDGWRRSVVVSDVRRMNEVDPRRARFVPGWVTVFGRLCRFGM